MRRTLTGLALLLALSACDSGPTAPTTVTVTPATNCAPTGTTGEILMSDESRPADAIDQVSGQLFNEAGNQVCAWTISREGNNRGTFLCRGLSPGDFTFSGQIDLNTGQAPTSVTGRCTLP